MNDFRAYLGEQLENSVFRKEWDDLESEFSTIQANIDAEKDKKCEWN